MLRVSFCGLLVIVVIASCRTTEREGANPLPEDAAPLTYTDMVNRARGQATSALDSYYVDAWLDLEQTAQRLEQTARLLPKATQVPEAFKIKVEPESEMLRKDAVKLLEAARAKDATQVNDALQRINQRIRQLRPAEKSEIDKK